jgi:D-amino-acid dehydrogenase
LEGFSGKMNRPKPEVIIVGAGIIGLCSAYYLSKKGLKVKILESSPEFEGCSHGNAGHICQSHIVPLSNPDVLKTSILYLLNPKSPFYIRPRIDLDLFSWGRKFIASSFSNDFEKKVSTLAELGKRSLRNYHSLFRDIDFEAINKNGILTVCNTKEGFEKEIAAANSTGKFGIKFRVLKKEEILNQEGGPDLMVEGGILYPEDISVDPSLLMFSLQDWLSKNGTEIIFDCSVSSFSQKSQLISSANTNKGDFYADQFLVANGAWAPRLWNSLGSRIYMQAAKGYSMELSNPGTLNYASIIFSEKKVVITPMGEKLRLAGTLELSGFDGKIRKRRVEGIIIALREYAPQLYSEDLKEKEIWFGYRPTTPDGLPYLGGHPKIENLFINAGHAMLGLAFAAASGDLISNIMADPDSESLLGGLSPTRF